MKGCDYAWQHPSPGAIVQAGCGFVMRYLSYDSTKNLSATERDALLAAGLGIGLVWEAGAQDPLGGYAKGVTEAQKANAEALDLGLGGAPIYFAFDFDITDAEKPEGALYLEGCASVIGKDRVGMYGDYYEVLDCVKNGRPVTWFWQTVAWSGGLVHPAAHILQSANGQIIGGASVDIDTALKADFGVTFSLAPSGGNMTNVQYLQEYQQWRDWRLLEGADPAKRPTTIPSLIPSDWWTALQDDIALQNSAVSAATTQLNAEVQQLQQQLSTVQDELTTAQTTLSQNESQLSTLEQEVATVKGLLSQASAALA